MSKRATRSHGATVETAETAETAEQSSQWVQHGNSSSLISPEQRTSLVARSAYLRAEKRGFAPGADWEDWFAAEAEVDARLRAS
jgi:hypothetical protein